MNTTYLTILLACASGLAVVAFRTPNIYIKLHPTILGIQLLVAILAAAWSAGHSESFQELLQFVFPENINAAAAANSKNGIPVNFFLYLALSTIYPIFLRWLSQEVIDHTDNKEPKTKVDNK
jgi:hypothetical protein